MKIYVRNIKWNLADSQDSSLYPKQATIKIPDNFGETFTKDELILETKTRLISTFSAQIVSAEYQFNLKEE
jgi:hypothetical protein